MARMISVELKRWHTLDGNRVYGWQPIPVTDALRLRDETFRCPECKGRVKLMSASVNPPMAAHGEHFQRNKGCSLGDCFNGVPKLHPAALG